MTVRKKAATKKRVSKKTAVKNTSSHEDVMAHDPLSMIDDTLSMLSEPVMDDNDFGESLASSDSVQEEQTLDTVLNEMADEQPLAKITEVQQAAFATNDEPLESLQPEMSAEINPDTTQINAGEDKTVESALAERSNWSGGELQLGDSLTIMDAENLKNDFLKIIIDGMGVTLDASELEQVDGAGLQLLAAFYKDAMRKGVAVNWNKISRSLDDAVTMMGMKEALGLRDVEIEDSGEGVAWGLF